MVLDRGKYLQDIRSVLQNSTEQRKEDGGFKLQNSRTTLVKNRIKVVKATT